MSDRAGVLTGKSGGTPALLLCIFFYIVNERLCTFVIIRNGLRQKTDTLRKKQVQNKVGDIIINKENVI
jgi:hypothetical protein